MQFKTIVTATLIFLSISGFSQISRDVIPDGYNKKFKAGSAKSWDKKRVNAFIVDKNGNTYQGQVLHFGEKELYFYASDTMFYKNPDKDLIYSFPSNEIHRLVLKRPTRITEGFIAGTALALAAPVYAIVEFAGSGEEGWLVLLVPALFIGSAVMTVPLGLTAGYLYGVNIDYKTDGDSMSYQILSDELAKYSVFKKNLPEEFLIPGKEKKSDFATEELPVYRDRKDILGYNKWDIGLYAAPMLNKLSDDFKIIGNSLPVDYSKTSDMSSPIIGFDLGYRVHRNIRVGLEISGWTYSTAYEDYYFDSFLDPYSSFWFDYFLTSFALKCDYIYKPVRRLMSRRNEFSFGLGISTNSLYTIITENYYFSNGDYDFVDTEPDPLFNSHLGASIAYDLYIFQFVSARAAVHGLYALNELKMPSLTVTDINDMEYTIPQFPINTSSLSFELGLRLHF